METQTRLSCHNKFISAGNITILSVSSDDYLHASLEVADLDADWISIYLSIYLSNVGVGACLYVKNKSLSLNVFVCSPDCVSVKRIGFYRLKNLDRAYPKLH